MRTLGIDLGTSGVRAVLLDEHGARGSHAVPLAAPERWEGAALWGAVAAALQGLDLAGVRAIAVDGTSGTLVPVGADGRAVGGLSPYHARADAGIVAAIPAGSAARGATSPLARAIGMLDVPGLDRVLHEADWIAGMLCGRFDASDANNALKTGYDPQARAWPDWVARLGMPPGRLPVVLAPGTTLGRVTPDIARAFRLPHDAVVAAGTTDGCASFLATGADQPGCGVTALGSTLTLKLLSDRPVLAPEYGVYSHHLLGRWLAGGASNSGGAVLAQHFSPAQLETLSRDIDPARDSGLELYPLPQPGERFPINDPDLPPRMERPASDSRFLHALLEGMARIEALGYRRLAELGAPRVTHVLSVGGGAANPVWTAMRARILGVAVTRAPDASAALGAAMLARRALA